MSDEAVERLEDNLKGYKEKINNINKGFLEWERDLIFTARTMRGYEIEFDPRLEWGCSPTESLLISAAGCMAIDVFYFLQKMRAEIKKFRIDFTGERRTDPPQYYRSMEFIITVEGDNISPKKLQRAISLSQEKYCSVYHSLRSDIEFSVRYRINGQDY